VSLYEIGAHRIGGAPGPRVFRGSMHTAPYESTVWLDLIGQESAALSLQLILSDWHPADEEWWAATAELRAWDGYPIGRRPILVYGQLYDVPTHALFRPRHPDVGTYSLSLRRV